MSATSPHVPSTRQCETNSYWLLTRLLRGRRLFSFDVEERDVPESRELVFHLRIVADDDDDGVFGAEQRIGAALDLLRRESGNLADERLRIVLGQSEDIHRVQHLGETALGCGLNREDAPHVRLCALQFRSAAAFRS